MAKLGNLLRGQLTGRVGNNYFRQSRSATGRPVTVMGTINTSPSNPRTASQMIQRAKFANAVKFYRHSQSNFYKFAFERQRPNENDYNAFMRFNIARSPLLPKSWVDNALFPAWSEDWLFSSGSLNVTVPEIGIQSDNQGIGIKLDKIATAGNETIGQVSQQLMRERGFQKGDIVTVAVIVFPGLEYVSSLDEWQAYSAPVWVTYQFIIDPNSYRYVGDMAFRGVSPDSGPFVNSVGSLVFPIPNVYGVEVNDWYGSVVISRKVKGRLETIVSRNAWTDGLADTIAEQLATYSEDEILETWRVQDSATLQGAVATAGEGSGSTSDGVPVVRSITQDSQSWSKDKMSKSSLYGVHVKGVNLGNLSKSSFTLVNATAQEFQQYSAQIYQLIFRTGSTAGAVSISYGDVTWSGTVV